MLSCNALDEALKLACGGYVRQPEPNASAHRFRSRLAQAQRTLPASARRALRRLSSTHPIRAIIVLAAERLALVDSECALLLLDRKEVG